MNPTTVVGKNITTIPTQDIQRNLGGGLVVDNKYGPKTTAAVVKFQTENGLKPDGIFGPLTQSAYDKKFNSSIVSTGDIHDKAKTDSSELDSALTLFNINYQNPDQQKLDPNSKSNTVVKDPIIDDTVSGTINDPLIKGLDEMAKRSNDSTKMLVSNIKAIKERERGAVEKQYNNYKAGLQLLGIQTNQAQVTPDLLASHMNEVESEKIAKINTLDSEEISALAEAENARANSDFKTLSEKMDYVKQIRNEKSTALKEYQKALLDAKVDVVESAKIAKTVSHDIYDTLLSLDDTDKEPFLVAISKKFNLPLGSIVTALTDEQTTRQKDSAKDNKDNDELSRTDLEAYNEQGYKLPIGTTYGEVKKMGIVPKNVTKAPSDSTVDTQTKKTVISNLKKRFSESDKNDTGYSIKGDDGYIDPAEYLNAYKQWEWGDKEFLANFPVDGKGGLINPKSYNALPEAIRPKIKETASEKRIRELKEAAAKK